jgi:hypothetical protein
MTNEMNLTDALTIIANEMADHLRVRTLIISGHPQTAILLLDERMQSMIRSYAEEGGRACGPDEFLAALEVANNSFGPLVILQSRLVAIAWVDTFKSMIAALN